ncbi:hypothetical protein [Actinomycetospora sp.]|uniref:hypothetical protein n=1 Tax=Actinomycetospora sp. TaxID=1872135 RepID=UPI002F42EBE6
MSRSDTPTTTEPRVPRAERTVHRRSAPVPLRVVSQRLTPEQARPPEATPVTGHATGAAAALARPPLPSPEIVGLPAVAERPLPVLDRRPRHTPFTRLMSLVRGRRRAERCGRHRPDTTPSRAWSMFAPQRRSRRRFGVRR